MKTRRDIWFVLTCLSLSGSVSGSRLITDLQSGFDRTVVVYGTSLTAGGAWVPLMGSWLAASYPGQATIINSGMPGLASGSGLANLASRVTIHQPDAVFIEFSMNDAYTGYGSSGFPDSGLTPSIARANLEGMIDGILAADPTTEVFLQTMNVPCGAGAAARPGILAYVQNYRDVSLSRNLLLVDHYPAWSSILAANPGLYTSYVPDCVHPVQAGIEVVMMPSLKRELRGRARTDNGNEGAGARFVPEPAAAGWHVVPWWILLHVFRRSGNAV